MDTILRIQRHAASETLDLYPMTLFSLVSKQSTEANRGTVVGVSLGAWKGRGPENGLPPWRRHVTQNVDSLNLSAREPLSLSGTAKYTMIWSSETFATGTPALKRIDGTLGSNPPVPIFD
jgi:hypothetical protein